MSLVINKKDDLYLPSDKLNLISPHLTPWGPGQTTAAAEIGVIGNGAVSM